MAFRKCHPRYLPYPEQSSLHLCERYGDTERWDGDINKMLFGSFLGDVDDEDELVVLSPESLTSPTATDISNPFPGLPNRSTTINIAMRSRQSYSRPPFQ